MKNKGKVILERYEIDGDYPKMKRELLILFGVMLTLPSDGEIEDYAEDWEENNNDKEYPIPCRDEDETSYTFEQGALWMRKKIMGNEA